VDGDLEKYVCYLEAEGKMSREDILSKVDEKVNSCHGIVSQYGALYSLGRDLGVDIGEIYSHTRLNELSGDKPVSVSAKVKDTSGVRPFRKKDGSFGQYAALTLQDESGEIRLVVWGGPALLVGKVMAGDIVSAQGFVLKSYQGRMELHSTAESKVRVHSKSSARL
jgi:replication factor A1